MAHYEIRCNLVSATFPFIADIWGRTVIVPQMDFNYDRQAAASIADYDKDKGIPQLFYAHNVMPTAQGSQAIGFDTVWPGLEGINDFDRAFPIITTTRNRFVFVPAGGCNYIANANTGEWQKVNPFPSGTVSTNAIVTVAYVAGETYICYANYGIFVYDDVNNQFVATTPAGIIVEEVLAICEANGYLIAVTEDAVAWSSLLDPLNFVPSLDTGASGSSIAEAKGKLRFCAPISGGFMIYCDANVVGASYTGNIQFPFTFRQINGSGRVDSPENVSWQANASEHYIYSVNGFQRISRTDSQLVFPELADFVAAHVYEVFDENTLQFVTERLPNELFIHVAFVTSRFIVVSYGKVYNEFTFALIYDIALKRWGKIKIDHRDCFQWNYPNLSGNITYEHLSPLTYGQLAPTTYGQLDNSLQSTQEVKTALAFLQADGTVKIVNFDIGNPEASGVLVAGKYQIIRNNFIIHLDSEVEVVDSGVNFSYHLLPTLDGKTFLPAVTPMLTRQATSLRKFSRKYTCQSFASVFKGSFYLSSFQIKVMPGPTR